MQVIAVIPTRYASRRFPGKALVSVGGMPLIERVARQVLDAEIADEVVVATDDARIAEAVALLDVTVVQSSERFRTGSDRVAAAVAGRAADDAVIINVQGDEALVDAEVLSAALAALDESCDLSTVAGPLAAGEETGDTSVVKVLVDELGWARAFSRGAIDVGGTGGEGWGTWRLMGHMGVYAFKRAALAHFADLPTSAGEASEDLEQLRALDNGMRIAVWPLRGRRPAVNRIEDVARVEALLASQSSTCSAARDEA